MVCTTFKVDEQADERMGKLVLCLMGGGELPS